MWHMSRSEPGGAASPILVFCGGAVSSTGLALFPQARQPNGNLLARRWCSPRDVCLLGNTYMIDQANLEKAANMGGEGGKHGDSPIIQPVELATLGKAFLVQAITGFGQGDCQHTNCPSRLRSISHYRGGNLANRKSSQQRQPSRASGRALSHIRWLIPSHSDRSGSL